MNTVVCFNNTAQNINFTDRKIRIIKKQKKLPNKETLNEEQKQTDIRKNLEWIFKKLGFGEKLRNGGNETQKNINDTSNTVKSTGIFRYLKKHKKNNNIE